MRINISNPPADQSMSEAERKFAHQINHSYAQIVKRGEEITLDEFQQRGVPEDVASRTLIHIHKWRSATQAAHYLALEDAPEDVTQTAIDALVEDFRQTLLRQLPLSRETFKRTKP